MRCFEEVVHPLFPGDSKTIRVNRGRKEGEHLDLSLDAADELGGQCDNFQISIQIKHAERRYVSSCRKVSQSDYGEVGSCT